MFSKIDVNGDAACDLYKYLTSTLPDEEGKQEVAWNFTKFLVDGSGTAVKRFGPQVTPEEIGEALREYL